MFLEKSVIVWFREELSSYFKSCQYHLFSKLELTVVLVEV